MPTLEEVATQSLEERLSRMSRTADDLAAAIRGHSEAALVRRPDGKNWAATEVICHLRDIEEVYFVRFHAMLSNDDPKIYANPSAADRFAEDRQYLRNDAAPGAGRVPQAARGIPGVAPNADARPAAAWLSTSVPRPRHDRRVRDNADMAR
jgi:DinB family protein